MNPTGEDWKLWCIVEGYEEPIGILIQPSRDVDDLKTAIKVKQPSLFSVDTSSIAVWKVGSIRSVPCKPDLSLKLNESIDVSLAEGLLSQGRPLSDFATKLKPSAKLLKVFPQKPADEDLRIVVTIQGPSPSSSNKSNLSGFNQAESDLWLKELHSCIWNKKNSDVERNLRREVEVTEAHYHKLQEHLEERYPDHEELNGLPDVLDAKLKVLQLTIPAEVSSPRNPDDSEEDVSELASLFPFTLRFLDLSNLELQNVSARFPLTILHRQEYGVISNLINSKNANSSGSVIVSGQPGTGKTTYLHLRMIEYMIEGRPFLYQTKKGTVYHVTATVEPINRKTWADKHIVAFVDGDDGEYEPDQVLYDISVQIIVAASPRGTGQKWQKPTHCSFTTLVTQLWSREELLLSGIFLHRLYIPFELLNEATSYFGYNPRRCFEASISVDKLKEKKDTIKEAIITAVQSGNIMDILLASRSGYDGPLKTVPHKIFEIFPASPSRKFIEGQIGFVSRWAFDILCEALEKSRRNAVSDFFLKLKGIPGAESLRGHLFEDRVLNYLEEASHLFTIRRLTDSEEIPWQSPDSLRHYIIHDSTVSKEIEKSVSTETSLHMVPENSNFSAVDSIIYDPTHGLTCIQVTMCGDHPIAVSGLQRVQRWLKIKTPLKELRPSRTKPWRFIFVVPKVMACTFKEQSFQNDTANGAWAEKVEQYVLGLDVFDEGNGNQKMDISVG